MWYDKNKVKIVSPKEWYDLLYKNYDKHHPFLSNWDKWMYNRFFSSQKKECILEIGAWDWRIFRNIDKKNIISYYALDASEKMLSKFNWQNLQKIVHDIEQPMPFIDCFFDKVIWFFVLLHVDNIEKLFEEINRVLKHSWEFIVLHHIEKKQFEHNVNWNKFKIKSNKYSYNYIEELAKYNFFEINSFDIIEKNCLIWKIYKFTK